MFYVYILKSIKFKNKVYTGFTTNIDRRLSEHNRGLSRYTNQLKPWEVVSYFVFKDYKLAQRFERYLKRGSGIAFMRKHLL